MTAATPDEASAPADAIPLGTLARRDGLAALGLLSAFAAADAWHAATSLRIASLLTTLNGIAAGILLGGLAHEWGHFAGARFSGAAAPTKKGRLFQFIFDFDLQKNSERAFRAMSFGGNLGHWAFVALLALALPLDTPGRCALLASAFGVALAASVTEFPILQRSYAGATPAESFRGLSAASLSRDRWIGAAAGVALFLIL